ncbi:hypothetical protein PCE1_001994 [Barthelona sp. PCE]
MAPNKGPSRKVRKYRGIDVVDLFSMEESEFMKLLPSRIRRKFTRGLRFNERALIEKCIKAKDAVKDLVGVKPKPVKTHLRSMIVHPAMVGSIVAVYNGINFNVVEVRPEMIGYYLGEFSLSYKPVQHGDPGKGATRSSTATALK